MHAAPALAIKLRNGIRNKNKSPVTAEIGICFAHPIASSICSSSLLPGEFSFVSLGYNGFGASTSFNEPGDQVGIGNPGLAPLADNGGATLTHALLPYSPALDAGNPSAMAGVDDVPLYDQRGTGFSRINLNSIDIGAFETQIFERVVDTLEDEENGDLSSGNYSLREAIALANSTGDIESILFDSRLDGGTIALDPTLGQLQITISVTIDASPLRSGITINAQGASRAFNIDDGDHANGW